MERLDKLVSQRSSLTRSEARSLIKRGEVAVNGEVCKSCDKKFDSSAEIVVGGKSLGGKYLYLMMNKPEGVVCATKDSSEKTVLDILPPQYKNRGLFPAGRLDKDTTGLLLLTNDGEFSHRIMSPNKNVYKYYIAQTDKPLSEDDISLFRSGIVFKDGTKCKSAFAENLKGEGACRVGVKICEGKYHQVKKMLAVCGVKVQKLERISIGFLTLDIKLPKGGCRELTDIEISQILFSSFT